MSRSGYSDDCENPELWRTAVDRALQGRRGQAFLREMLLALDALPEKKLIADDLVRGGEVCAIAAVGKARGMDMTGVDPEAREAIAGKFGIAFAMVCEIFWINDEGGRSSETPEERFARVRRWVERQLIEWDDPLITSQPEKAR